MKTNLFRKNHSSSKWGMRIMRLALLLLPLLGRGLEGGFVLLAQTGVAVSGLAVNAGTVTFNVSWDRNAMPVELWSDTVWVFVDYNKNGVMERLPVTSATASAGTVTKIPNNDKGVWVTGNARDAGTFSATVQLFTTVKDVGGACVYGSNYPPVGEYNISVDKISISFTGTPPYDLVLEHETGSTITRLSGSDYDVPASYTVQSFSDKTGAPGLLNGIPPLAASARLWTVGSQIWSDVINVPECDHDAFTNSATVPYCRSYTVSGKKWYYYNWSYVNANKNTLCPSPWHVPTKDDFIALDIALGGTGLIRGNVAQTWITDKYITAWGATYGLGRSLGSDMIFTEFTHFWSANVDTTESAFFLEFNTVGWVGPQRSCCIETGYQVKCVK
jgi:uncharacterized protein (TIGR02145 family)